MRSWNTALCHLTEFQDIFSEGQSLWVDLHKLFLAIKPWVTVGTICEFKMIQLLIAELAKGHGFLRSQEMS